jgi:hypothetical protein
MANTMCIAHSQNLKKNPQLKKAKDVAHHLQMADTVRIVLKQKFEN